MQCPRRCLPVEAVAQSISVKWGTTYKPVYLHIDMPAGCDRALGRAVTTWNNAASRFQYQFDPAANLTGTRWTEANNANVTIEDGATSTSTALMSTRRHTSGSTIVDADIIVKADYLWYYNDDSGGRFYCPRPRRRHRPPRTITRRRWRTSWGMRWASIMAGQHRASCIRRLVPAPRGAARARRR